MMPDREKSLPSALAAIGLLALTGFAVAFANVAWDWSMFMDDTLYNTWMPGVRDVGAAFREEIKTYLALGRFYPVKYIANLLKWRYLPNDPFAFREFNFAVFLLTAAFGALAALRVCRERLRGAGWSLAQAAAAFLFLVGGALLHKPLLEVISLNPLGETWVCLFFAMGAFCLFHEHWLARAVLARFFFLLVALSKEPAALAFFAAGAYGAARAFLEPRARARWAVSAAIDFSLFAFFLGTALYVMAHGTFTRNAYFLTTPWLTYAHDFVYKLLRYALWTSPFLAAFLLCRRHLARILRERDPRLLAALVFFASFGLAYDVFMASQGIVAYQQTPAAIGYFGLFSTLLAALFSDAEAGRTLARRGAVLLCLFCLSYYVSVGRWLRFVRGMVEPRKAVVNLIQTGGELSLFVPRGEVFGHVELLLKQFNPASHVFDVNDDLARVAPNLHGKVVAFEFPVYMGNLDPAALTRLEALVGGWASVSDAGTYRIYVGKKTFGEPAK